MTDDLKTEVPAGKKPKPVRWSRVVLLVSLALNLAVVGVIGGAALRHDTGAERGRALQAREFGYGPFVKALEHGERRALGQAFARSAGRPEEARREVGEMFHAMISALKQEPFDRDGFEELLLKQQKQFADRQEIGAKLVVDQIADMSASARADYADRLEQMLRRPPGSSRRGAARPQH